MIVRNKENRLSLLFAWHGTILSRIYPTIIGVMGLSLLAWALNYYQFSFVGQIPAVGFTIFGVVISIFLGFRNNACYERWWEGRKLWGWLIANTRHFSRDTLFLEKDIRQSLLLDMLVFVALLRDRLRHKPINIEWFEAYYRLDDDFITLLKDDINPPQRILEKMQKTLIKSVKEGHISDIVYTSIQKHLVEMGNVQAGCDRILNTPLPFPYSVLLHRAVFCFCWALPFGLTVEMGLWAVLLVGFISYLLLGLDALSHQLEEPFGDSDHDLPLDTMVRLIEREILNLLDMPMPKAWQADKDYWYH